MYGGTIKYGIRLKSLTAFLMPNYYLLRISSSLDYFAMFASLKMAILNLDWTRIIDIINEIIPISMAICEDSESFFEKIRESLPSNLFDHFCRNFGIKIGQINRNKKFAFMF